MRNIRQLPLKPDYVVEAGAGVSACRNYLDMIAEKGENYTVYTNSILALNNKYVWNEEVGLPEVYIRAGEHMLFTPITKLTPKTLRKEHNLAKLYLAGHFDR